MSAILKHAASKRLCEPVRIKRRKEPKSKLFWLKHEEAIRLLEACSDHIRPLVLFYLHTGCRKSEALRLDWEQIDLEAKTVRFLHTKSDEDRTVPLHPDLVEALAAIGPKSGAVFLKPNGQPFCAGEGASGCRKSLASASKRAGLRSITPHVFRHTWATWFYKDCKNLVSLMALGGWKTAKVALRYAHPDVDRFSEDVENMKSLVA